MGSYALSPPSPSTSLPTRKSIHVLVTGFGPFHTIRLNPSHLIALALPPTLTTENYDIHIHAHPKPIEVSYHYVREVVPLLLFPPPSPGEKEWTQTLEPEESWGQRAFEERFLGAAPVLRGPSLNTATTGYTEGKGGKEKALYDVVLFMGVAPNRACYSLETRARRDEFAAVDADGHHVGKHAFPKEQGVPRVLRTGVDAEEVLVRWREGCADISSPLQPPPTLSLSHDAGHYLCEFIYYTGLCEYYKREPAASEYGDPGTKRPVLFLHVPKGDQAGDIDRGALVAEELIGAVVGWMGEGKGGGVGNERWKGEIWKGNGKRDGGRETGDGTGNEG